MLALTFVFAAVEEDVSSTIAGDVVAAAVEVDAVLDDFVVLLQPLRANPAKTKVNNKEFFIGGLICVPTDPGTIDRFTEHPARRAFRGENVA